MNKILFFMLMFLSLLIMPKGAMSQVEDWRNIEILKMTKEESRANNGKKFNEIVDRDIEKLKKLSTPLLAKICFSNIKDVKAPGFFIPLIILRDIYDNECKQIVTDTLFQYGYATLNELTQKWDTLWWGSFNIPKYIYPKKPLNKVEKWKVQGTYVRLVERHKIYRVPLRDWEDTDFFVDHWLHEQIKLLDSVPLSQVKQVEL